MRDEIENTPKYNTLKTLTPPTISLCAAAPHPN